MSSGSRRRRPERAPARHPPPSPARRRCRALARSLRPRPTGRRRDPERNRCRTSRAPRVPRDPSACPAGARPPAGTVSWDPRRSGPDRIRDARRETRNSSPLPAPLTASSATRNRRARIRSTSTCRSTRSMCNLAGRRESKVTSPISSLRALAELALVVEVDQLAALVVIEEEAVAVEQLQRVVLRRIVRRRDGQSPARSGLRDVNHDASA